MTDAHWCNMGDHPFDGARADTVLIGNMEQVPNQWGGQQPHYTTNLREICGDCAAAHGLITQYTAPPSPEDRHAELLAAIREQKDK